jgi:hypothetical protein
MALPPRIGIRWFDRKRLHKRRRGIGDWRANERLVVLLRPDVARVMRRMILNGPDDHGDKPGMRLVTMRFRGSRVVVAPNLREPMRVIVAPGWERDTWEEERKVRAEEESMLATIRRVTGALRPQARAGLIRRMRGPFGVPMGSRCK